MVKVDNIKTGPEYLHYYSQHLHEKPLFKYAVAISIISTLIISIFILINVYQLKRTLLPTTVNVNDFIKKLTSHDELKNYIGVTPLNVVQVTSNNLAGLQSQVNGLDITNIGEFLVQYPGKLVLYDYKNDKIKGNVNQQQAPQPQLPADFFTKLNKHAELQGLQEQKPIGGQLDASSLNALRQQFPDVYSEAKVGDYLLRYQTKLVIFDYSQNKVIKAVDLQLNNLGK